MDSQNVGGNILPVVLVISVSLFTTGIDGGHVCSNCVDVAAGVSCHNYTECGNDEICHMVAYKDHFGQVLRDYGCKSRQACYHSIEPVAIGRRSVTTHNDVMCDVCCNVTRMCNQKLSCNISGTSAISVPTQCSDLGLRVKKNGTYTIYPYGSIAVPVDVCCEFDADGNVWTVIQRRHNGSVDFYRNWQSYKDGFGPTNGEYWIGNDVLNHLTSQAHNSLRIVMSDFEYVTKYAEYSTFRVDDESRGYRLFVEGYSGNAGDAMTFQNGSEFSTFDRDNDANDDVSCARHYHGAWWYSDCHLSNLNGQYLRGHHDTNGDGINWNTWRGGQYSLKATTMMIRKT